MANSSNKKTIFIHIGFGKTGTSAFQKTMFYNKGKLSKMGLLYPETGTLGTAHHNLTWLHGDTETNVGKLEILIGKLKEEFLESKCRKLFLSSECFIYSRRELLEKYKEILGDIDIKIIIYLREHRRFIESVFLQRVKVGQSYSGSIEEFVRQNNVGLNFRKKITPWEDIFGKENLIIKLYDRRLVEDISKSILEVIGINDKLISLGFDVINYSLSPCFLKVMQEVDKIELNTIERENIVNKLLKLSYTHHDCLDCKLIDEDLSMKIFNLYRKDDEYLAAKYLSDIESKYFLPEC